MAKRNIVVGIDFSEYSNAAINEATVLARQIDASLLLVHVSSPALPGPASLFTSEQEWEEIVAERATQEGLEARELAERVKDQGLSASHRILSGDPAEQLTAFAQEEGSEMILVGTHGLTGVKAFLLGSVAQGVIRHAGTNVWVARNPSSWHDGPQQILLATDFSEHAENAMRVIVELAPDDTTIDIVHAWQVPVPLMPPGSYGSSSASLATLMQDLSDTTEQRGADLIAHYKTSRLHFNFQSIAGPAASAVIDHAKREGAHYDLIVTGSHGRRGVRRFFLGSVAEKIVRHAPCSTLVVHGKGASEDA